MNLRIIRELEGGELRIADSPSLDDREVKELLCGAAVVLDALLGTGTTGAPRGEAGRLIKLSAGCGNILALDIPSGIAPDLRQDNNRRHRRPSFKGSSANPGAFLIL